MLANFCIAGAAGVAASDVSDRDHARPDPHDFFWSHLLLDHVAAHCPVHSAQTNPGELQVPWLQMIAICTIAM